MSTRSEIPAQKALAVDSVKRKLDFDELRNYRTEAEFPRALTWRKKKGRRLDFGETDPAVRLRCPDLLPDRCDHDLDSVTMPPHRERRIVFTAEQKATLEATFRNKKYLSREEKATLAAKLDLGIVKVQNWFKNRRLRWRKEQKKGAVGLSGFRPILPGTHLIETSCKQSFKSTASFNGFPQFYAKNQVPLQPLCSSHSLAIAQPVSASQQMTQSYAASSSWTQQQQHTATESFPARRSLPLVNPVKQDIHQLPAVEPRRLADEFPFSYSIDNELPHILGNLKEDQFLNRPLTPSFDASSDRDPLWEPLALKTDQTQGNQASPRNVDLVECVSPNYRRVQPSSLNSCCFGNGEFLSSPPLGELSCGFLSKGRSFMSCRQD